MQRVQPNQELFRITCKRPQPPIPLHRPFSTTGSCYLTHAVEAVLIELGSIIREQTVGFSATDIESKEYGGHFEVQITAAG